MASAEIDPPRRIGRYLIYGPIASGGMATVHYGALVGEAGFSRTVAVKRIRADRRCPDLHASLADEARLVSRVRHPNVVSTLDVLSDERELYLVLEYIAGETLSRLLRRIEARGERMGVRYAVTIMAGVLHGLHAAHDAKSARNKPLAIVHRDVSPQNVLVGVDGLARVLDFGIAKANDRISSTRHGQLKGKLGYVAPEQLRGQADRRTDIYASAVVLWEMLTGKRLFWGETSGETMQNILEMPVPPPSAVAPEVGPELDRVVLTGLARDPDRRFDSARHFAVALEATGIAAASQVGAWVQELADDTLADRSRVVAALERHASHHETAEAAPRGPIPTDDEPHTRELDDPDATELSGRGLDEEAELSTVVVRDRPAAEAARSAGRRALGRRWLLALAVLGAGSLILLLVPSDPPARAAPMLAGMRWPAIAPAIAPAPSPAPSASIASSAPAASGAPPVRRLAPRPRPPSCDPPFSIDERGVRRLKPECL